MYHVQYFPELFNPPQTMCSHPALGSIPPSCLLVCRLSNGKYRFYTLITLPAIVREIKYSVSISFSFRFS